MSSPTRRIDAGDQSPNMTAGYLAAADRIEVEIGPRLGLCLDVGCNVGSGMVALAERWPLSLWEGLEPCADRADAARAKGFAVYVSPAERFSSIVGRYDFIFARHSIEHTTQRGRALGRLWHAMSPSACIYIQAPIEPDGSTNELHVSPYCSLDEMRDECRLHFDELYWGPQPTVAEFIGRRGES